jgi:aquaporin Z
MGLAMGFTAIGIIYSPWGKQSGAHINPSITLAFLRLGKIEPWDAVFYMGAQFVGGLSAVLLIALLLGSTLAHPSVNYVATIPGTDGTGIAFLAEFAISFILMSVVLVSTNTQKLSRWTGLFAGVLVATYIAVEAPLSGMSMNPARTFASALPAQLWTALWVYFTAPLIGMLLAAELYLRLKGAHEVFCAKLIIRIINAVFLNAVTKRSRSQWLERRDPQKADGNRRPMLDVEILKRRMSHVSR